MSPLSPYPKYTIALSPIKRLFAGPNVNNSLHSLLKLFLVALPLMAVPWGESIVAFPSPTSISSFVSSFLSGSSTTSEDESSSRVVSFIIS